MHARLSCLAGGGDAACWLVGTHKHAVHAVLVRCKTLVTRVNTCVWRGLRHTLDLFPGVVQLLAAGSSDIITQGA